jgi:hypothetical protein
MVFVLWFQYYLFFDKQNMSQEWVAQLFDHPVLGLQDSRRLLWVVLERVSTYFIMEKWIDWKLGFQ